MYEYVWSDLIRRNGATAVLVAVLNQRSLQRQVVRVPSTSTAGSYHDALPLPVPARCGRCFHVSECALLTGTLLDTEQLSTQSLQMSVGKFDKVFTWDIKQKILGLRKECWAPIVIAGEFVDLLQL